MELILISDSKLKVMLTSEDMKHYELDSRTLDYDNTETRRAFWNILDEAKHKTGFDAAKERIFVQVYPSRSGGCEMYVTKLGLVGAGEGKITYPREIPKKSLGVAKNRVYRFSKLDTMISACKLLEERGYTRDSQAYFDEEKRQYYLIISECSFSQKNNGLSEEYAFISEYGCRLSKEDIHFYIIEHCACICDKNAVELLSQL